MGYESKTDSMLWRLANRTNSAQRILWYSVSVFALGACTGFAGGVVAFAVVAG